MLIDSQADGQKGGSENSTHGMSKQLSQDAPPRIELLGIGSSKESFTLIETLNMAWLE